MTIPNAVGRIDEITEAIREGDREKAFLLGLKEHSRLIFKLAALEREMKQVQKAASQVEKFNIAIRTFDDDWNQARRDCGWKGEE